MLTFEQWRDAIIDRAEALLATCSPMTGGHYAMCSQEAVEALRAAFAEEFTHA